MKPLALVFALFMMGFATTVARAADDQKPPSTDESQKASTADVGQKAPSFEAMDDQGKLWKSADHVGKGVLVVYFYPAAMTRGCTKQACGFRDDMKALKAKGADVVGISGDEVRNLKMFKEEHHLNFTLLSDDKGVVAKAFGVPLKKGGHFNTKVNRAVESLVRGVTAARWTFVIDKNGTIVLKETQVNAPNDSKTVIKAIESL